MCTILFVYWDLHFYDSTRKSEADLERFPKPRAVVLYTGTRRLVTEQGSLVGMGSLWTTDGVSLFLSWIMNPLSFKSDGIVPSRSDSAGFWNALASSSKYGAGLFASGAPVKLQKYFRVNCSPHGLGQDFSSEQHWTRWLDIPDQGKRGGTGASFNWNLGTLKSRRSFPPWLGGPPDSSGKGKVKTIVKGLGGGSEEGPSSSTDNGRPNGTLTAVILGLNFLAFLGQTASKGRLLLWGAKINSLIGQGQLWRLFTPTILHANVFHLLINSYSLNSIGPTVESLTGPRRFLAVYSASALTSTTLSYFCCSAPSVGASGAIFGVVGALAVFLIRHRNMMVGGQQNLQRVASVIAVNLVLGFVADGIDNWSHFGGLLGGAAVAWLLGPVYTFEGPPGSGQRQLVDRPPISYLLRSQFRK